MKPKSLTPRQRRFVVEYLIDLNGTRAAIRAGYKPDNAAAVASRLLAKRLIRRAVREGMAARAARTEVSADKVVRELSIIAFSNVTDYRIGDGGRLTLRPGADPEALRAVAGHQHAERSGEWGSETATTIRLWDKLGALALLCQHLGILKPPQLPPLDALFAALPDDVAALVRGHLAAPVRGAGPIQIVERPADGPEELRPGQP